MKRLVLAALLVAACASDKPLCTPPDHTEYSCDPLPAGSPGCVGGPVWSPLAGSGSGTAYQDDAEKVFPDRCTAKIPDCSPYYMGDPREFECEGGGWGELL